MLELQLPNLRTILCLGAHSDDIEIGCGGTLLRLLAESPGLNVCWVVLSGAGPREAEAQRSAAAFLANAGERRIEVLSFRDSFFPYEGAQIKEFFGSLGRQINPDLVLTHRRDDRHQDHRVVAELTWNTFRDHLIWEYEIPKYEGDLGHPNLYVRLEEATCRQKIETLLTAFPSQRTKPWFSRETFLGLMRLRGLESNSSSGYAEAFHVAKAVL